MDSIKKWNSRLEKFWLVVAVLSTIAAFIFGFIDDFSGVEVYFLLSLMAWGIYLIRRGLRKKFSNND
tara:strand:- start:137 stop:337 length:201 start_codon:yes stop_codon:yes gene_type:complete